MDVIDRAQQLEERERDGALARALARNGEVTVRFSGTAAEWKEALAADQARRGICSDCGEAIEEARRAANPAARRCIDCQRRYEGVPRG